jgi:hypothetical protein
VSLRFLLWSIFQQWRHLLSASFFSHTFPAFQVTSTSRYMIQNHYLGNVQIENSHSFLLIWNSHQIFFSLYKKYKLNIFGLQIWARPFLQSLKSAVLQFSRKLLFYLKIFKIIKYKKKFKEVLGTIQIIAFYIKTDFPIWKNVKN